MAVNFTQALVNARRRASISGRPLSQQETAGIAAGEASTSSERAARLKALRLQEQQLAQQNAQFRDKMRFDEKQAEREERAAIASGVGGAIGVGAGYYIGAGIGSIGGPVGAIIGGTLGSAVGGAFSNTHLCTEASHVLDKIDNRHLRAYQKLRYYAKENFPACYRFYNDRGSEIIAGIQDAFPDPLQYREWWEEFYDKIITPMLDLPPDATSAYYNYITHVRDVLIPAYAPHQKAEVAELWHKDMMEVN